MGTTFVLLLLQCASTASGFIPSPMQQLISTPPSNNNNNGLYAHKENKKLMIVVGSTDEALASAMALCTRDVLLKTTTKHKRRSKIPRAQNIAFFNKRSTHHDKPQERLPSETISSLQNALLFLGPSLITYDQILANSLQLLSRISQNDDGVKVYDDNPMLYTSIDFGCEEGLKAMESLRLTRDRYSFLGLNLNTHLAGQDDYEEQGGSMSRETADKWGNELSTLLINDGSQKILPAAVIMDVRTHLAMLQANSIPKTNGVLGENDIWAIRGTKQDEFLIENIHDGILLDYNYDYSDPFGGCDPLLRPSNGYIVPSPTDAVKVNDETLAKANDAYAAAFSAVMGSGLDPLSSICIATSVKAIFIEQGVIGDNGVFCPPSYTWNTIDGIAEYTLQSTNAIRKEDGYPRKIYREFGYK